MSVINTVVYIIHLLSVLGILVLLLLETKKSLRRLNPGVLHASLTALIAGFILVGLHNSVKPEETLNHTIVGVKFLVLSVILGLGIKNLKKQELSRNVWLLMIGLTVFNIVIASAR
jgi:carbon starvation protein CstA